MKIKSKNNYKGFTLLELLVVILIIGVLVAIALPQYQRAKERIIMAEALQIARQVADANMNYYLIRNDYAEDMKDLDIEFIGKTVFQGGVYRVETNNFIVSTKGSIGDELAVVQRKPTYSQYYVSILRAKPALFYCATYAGATQIQIDLCKEVRQTQHEN